MILTNKHNLPDTIIRAMGESHPPRIGNLAVTALIDSPLIRYLKIKYWDQLEEDASDRLWALDGNADHYVIQRGAAKSDLIELALEATINGMVVSGRPDIITAEKVLIDIKRTSVYSFLLGEKESWSKQLNVYNLLYFLRFGEPLKKAVIWARLRDWVESKQYQNADYPQIPFFESEIELWPLEKTKRYIEERVELHIIADKMLKNPIPIFEGVHLVTSEAFKMIACTPADRWLRPTTYAVMKGKNIRAVRVLDSFAEAQQWMIDNGKTDKEFHVVERPGQAVRCERFCVCRPVCPLYK